MQSFTPAFAVPDYSGRLIAPAEEFMRRIRMRPDIFTMNRSGHTSIIEGICIACGILAGILMSNMQTSPRFTSEPLVGETPQEFREFPPVTVSRHPAVTTKTVPKPPESTADQQRTPGNKSAVRHEQKPGVGDPRARVAKKGVLAYIDSKMIIADARGAAEGIHATIPAEGIDAILQGNRGLRQGVGSVRRGIEGIGMGTGYGPSGFGGEGFNGDDLMGAGLPPVHIGDIAMKTPQRTPLEQQLAPHMQTAPIIGGRSKESIMREVIRNMSGLRYAYTRWQRVTPGLKGKIIVRFSIDEFGRVLQCDIAEAAIPDPAISAELVKMIHSWRFDKIDKVGDITEVVIPLVFTM